MLVTGKAWAKVLRIWKQHVVTAQEDPGKMEMTRSQGRPLSPVGDGSGKWGLFLF